MFTLPLPKYFYRVIKRVDLKTACTCPSCGATHSMRLEVGCRVYHYIFLPVYANHREVSVHCGTCAKNFEPKYFPNIPKMLIAELKKTPYPWYYFIGRGICIILTVLFIISIVEHFIVSKSTLANSIDSVGKGDVIVYEVENGKKTTLYVTNEERDTMYVRLNSKVVHKDELSEIDTPDNYVKEVTIFTKKKLREMADEGKVLDIYMSATALEFDKSLFEESDN